MAENAAHVSTTPHSNPTVFEVVAQESLLDSLYETTKRLCEYLRKKNPDKFNCLVDYFEEIYLFLNCFLQYHYMNKCGGSFSEAFYNLQRIPLTIKKQNNLSKRNKFLSLLVLVAVPYISRKIQVKVKKYEMEKASGNRPNQLYEELMKLYSYISMSYSTLKLIHYVRYITGRSRTHTPLLNFAGVQLVYQLDDSKKFYNHSWKEIFYSLLFPTSNDVNIKSVIVKLFCQSLEFSAFFIQFLNWWQSEEIQPKIVGYPVPKPPLLNNMKETLTSKGLCPICFRKRRVEVTLKTSGFVFCYKCIAAELEKSRKCPVTGLPSTKADLIRIYDVK